MADDSTHEAGDSPLISDIFLLTNMLPLEALVRMMGAEPQPVYAELAAECPMHERLPGIYTVMRMQEVVEITRHRSVLGNGSLERSMGGDRKLVPLDLDGPVHTQFRKLLDPVFAPKRIAMLEPSVRATAGAIVDTFAQDGEVDAFTAFCQTLPSRVFLSIMGLPEHDLDYFLEFKNGILRHEIGEDLRETERQRTEAGLRCSEYFSVVFDARQDAADRREDLISWLLTTEVEGSRLTKDEFINVCLLLMIAGLDTVSASLSCILSWLARHPEQRRWVMEDEARWPSAIEELMRFESPVPQGFRMANDDVEINGVMYPKGTRFTISWPAANLDPAAFDDPLTVKLDRSPNAHVDFATGRHRCLGSHLARMELRVALEEWHRRIPDYRVKEGVELQYIPLGVRQTTSLPLVWGAAT
jgi:cytochrome P450